MNKPNILGIARQRLSEAISNFQTPSCDPLNVSPWIVMSLMQKAIRRGNKNLAFRAAATLSMRAPGKFMASARLHRIRGYRRRRSRHRRPRHSGAGGEEISLGAGRGMRARSVVLTTGARYRRLNIANLDTFESTRRALLGIAAGSKIMRQSGSRPGRRWQLSRSGRRLFGEPGGQGMDAGAPARSCGDDVALSGRSRPRPVEYRSGERCHGERSCGP
jgi:hypothetical protein